VATKQKTVGIGVAGLGFMAATHLKACRQIPAARIVALCSRSGRNLDGDFSRVTGNVGANEPFRLEMKGVAAYRSFDELLANPEVDLIDLCTPTPFHVDLSVAALAAGKHVLCEKPLARSVKEARRILAAAKNARGFFMPAMCVRFWPEWAWLQRVIAQKTFGRTWAARFRRVAEPPHWGHKNFFDGAKSGGALFDLHIHDADFVQFCFGRPKSVLATGYSRLSGAIDHVVTQYRFDSGPIVHAEGTWAMTPGFGFNMGFTVNFENATVDYDLARATEKLKLFERGKPPQVITCAGPDGYVGELRHMIESIQKGTAPTVVTPEDAVSAVEICAAEEKSVATGKIVQV
jgi:predicted dehydrogenase